MSEAPVETVEEMFVQVARGTTSTATSVTLEGVSPSTLYFSDRPDRIVGHVTTEQFVEDWGLGPNSFEADPPNAVLSYAAENGDLDEIVVVLRQPDFTFADLTYAVEVLQGSLPKVAGPCTLFIDPLGMPLSPVSVCGVRRRERRRMRRRVL
jgi:hypothetical protein